ncbi:MAG TPA: inorganic diphosphatase [Chloroflexia bacterium]|nr:inorganic diphosphatase [Chloroflexia bacterium]
MATKSTPYDCLEAFDAESGDLNVIIETPKGSRNKFDYEPKLGVFKLGGVLPAGAVFPYDFGFVPATLGGDGDPMDVLVLMDEPAFAGCLVPSRLIGVIEAEQTERDGETTRNDRLIAVAANSRNHQDVNTLDDITTNLVDEIEHFFISYNEAKGKEFKCLARSGPERARRLVEKGIEEVKGSGYSGKKPPGKSKTK